MRNFCVETGVQPEGHISYKMLRNIILTGAVILLSGIFTFMLGQAAPAAKVPLLPGEITAIAENKITINTANGPVAVILNDKTEFKRTPAEKPSIAAATAAALSDAAVGDKVVVSGFPAADGKSIPARTVYLMTKADISQKHDDDGPRRFWWCPASL